MVRTHGHRVPSKHPCALAEDQSQAAQRAGGRQVHDRLAVARWINERGHIATEAVVEREMAAWKVHPCGAARQGGRAAAPTGKVGRHASDVIP